MTRLREDLRRALIDTLSETTEWGERPSVAFRLHQDEIRELLGLYERLDGYVVRVKELERETDVRDKLVRFALDVIEEHREYSASPRRRLLQDRLVELGLLVHPEKPVEGCDSCEEDPEGCLHLVPEVEALMKGREEKT